MKNVKKFVCMALAAAMLALCLTACGEKAPATPTPATIDHTFNTMVGSYIDAIGWYDVELYNLTLNKDGTYTLQMTSNRFGAEDYDMRGLRTITYSGTYTSVASADGEPSHFDVTLAAATQIAWDQQGKGFTRVATMPGNFFINTADWTEAMTTLTGTTAEEVLANFAKEVTVTVENPAVDPEDNTLSSRFVTLPEALIVNNGEG